MPVANSYNIFTHLSLQCRYHREAGLGRAGVVLPNRYMAVASGG